MKEDMMLSDYLALGISPDVSDEKIREAYLCLIKVHPPEKDPSMFQRLTSAYENIKDHRKRVHTRIFNDRQYDTLQEGISDLVKMKKLKKKRIGLQELLCALKKESS